MYIKFARSARSPRSSRTLVAVASVSLFISATTSAAPATYRMIEIPLSGYAAAAGINNHGDVVGDSSRGAFFYDHHSGAVNYLTFDSESFTTANGISDNGLIAGWASSPDVPFPVLWSTIGGAEALQPIFFASFANAVSDTGLIVGNFAGPGAPGGGALVWSGPQHTVAVLPSLVCFFCPNMFNTVANAVNNRGHIIGSSDFFYFTPPDFPAGIHAVEWRDGQVTDLGGLSGSLDSVANGINERDEIVGMSTVGSSGVLFHAFLYHRGKMADLTTLDNDPESSAAAINDPGEIVGWSGSSTSTRAFIYEHGQMFDLNRLIDPASPLVGVVHLDAAVAINSAGWIAANGTNSRDELQHAYLLIRTGSRSAIP